MISKALRIIIPGKFCFIIARKLRSSFLETHL